MKCKGYVSLILVVWLILALGWILNLVKFCECDFKAPYKAEVIRGVGILVAPVGIVVGWITIPDGPTL